MKKNMYIGTSGWSYPHWKETFYPEDVKPTEWLHFYAAAFSTVEINSSFYRTPSVSTVEHWHSQVPHNFLFSVKANRYITHQKVLKDYKENVEYLYTNIEHLKSKLGPILFQLPPYFAINTDRLAAFISLLDKKHKHVFEFRHSSWYTDEVYELLSKNRIALCITDLHGKQSPEEITSDFTYIRLHGPHKTHEGSYGKAGILAWKKKIEKYGPEVLVYCYFDNDEKGHAIQDAKMLQDLL